MQLDNLSPWAADVTPGWGQNRTQQLTCTVKIGFRWDEQGKLYPLSADDCPIVQADTYRGDDPESGSLESVADTVPFKSGFEWLLSGTVFPTEGATQQTLSISIDTQPKIQKSIDVFGPRQWQRTLFGWVPGKPAQVQATPVTWEHAFGGRFTSQNDKTKQYDANPIGCGFFPAAKHNASYQMPCFETSPFLKGINDRPDPAGFGAVSMLWTPRAEAFSSLDADAALEGRCPYPTNVSERLFNCAPRDQQLNSYPAGARVRLNGFHEHVQEFELPDLTDQIRLLVKRGSSIQRLVPICDTLLIDTDENTIALVWRAAIEWNPLSDQSVQFRLTAENIDLKYETATEVSA
ncbi:DUF2169 family type VI secretion system accessory protein [Reinekea blandensis]|uniref:DUF2169 domain-containing protein n=1 Tax=Reinekea blandensis MED297 TaxID=314283 RepID=A4BCY3_9GAMM|nr:DUF2169 domain-containing protein [Reinekea blandensis]EAR10065.1 hypothetical protein MED297_08251 [Reinekea sp. MED297] [Reinekea blandensis MED297]